MLNHQKQVIMKRLEKRSSQRWSRMLFVIVPMIFITACETTGYDGRDGRSYLALTYAVDEPDYVDAGTGSIPEYFYWDEYYRARTGFYTMYYDGYYRHGSTIEEYAWEIDYEIYYLEGEQGGHGYHGSDAPDMYFTVECHPYGPYYYEEELKMSLPEGVRIVSENSEQIELVQEKETMGIKVTYRRVEKR